MKRESYWTPERIRDLRERLGWSSESLAIHMGVSWHTICRWESGETKNLRRRDLEALDRLGGRRRKREVAI